MPALAGPASHRRSPAPAWRRHFPSPPLSRPFTRAARLARRRQVWVYDTLSCGHRAAVPADRLTVGDLNEVHKLDYLLLNERIEAVVHFAASTYVGESVREPAKYYQNNVVNALTLMECL